MGTIQASSVCCGLFFVFIVFIRSINAQKCAAKEDIPCGNNQCIRRISWCDKEKDCEDGSDEAFCKKVGFFTGFDPNKCKAKDNLFTCDNGQCFPSEVRCDGEFDCEDGSDEEECESYEDTTDENEKSPQITRELEHPDEEDPMVKTSDFDYSTERPTGNVEGHLERTTYSLLTDIVDYSMVHHNNVKSEDSDDSNEESIISTIIPNTTPTIPPFSPNSFYENRMKNAITDTSKHHYIPPQAREITSPQQKQTLPSHSGHASPTSHGISNRQQPHYLQPNNNPVSQPPDSQNSYTHQPQLPRYSTIQPQQTQYPPVQPQQPQYPPIQPQRSHYTPIQSQRSHYTPIQPQYSRYPPVQPQQSRHLPTQPQQPQYSRYPSQQPQYYPNQLQQSRYIPSLPQQPPNANYRPFYEYSQNDRRPGRLNSNALNLTPRAYTGHYRAPSNFYFQKNYTRLYNNDPSIRRAYEWLLEIRDTQNGWGKDTPRALIALSLVNNSFAAGTHEIDMLKKYFQVYLSIKLLRSETINKNRLAIFTNALLATCQNPKDFHGIDLIELLRREEQGGNTHFVHPFIHLSLCLADSQLSVNEFQILRRRLQNRVNYDQEKDMLSLAIMAYACHMQHMASSSTDPAYRTYTEEVLNNAISMLLEFRQSDGSFGSVYSTALATQALLSVNDSRNLDLEATFDFLKEQQTNNGSFGDILATYYVLPVLSGRSLLHLRNTHCNPLTSDRELTPVEILEYIGPRQYIRYSLHFGIPLTNSYSVDVLVPVGINFFDVMRVAEYQNDHFRFSYETTNESINVFSISNLPNDAEKGLAWHLYIKKDFGVNASQINNHELFTGDIRKLFPSDDQHFIFWYHPLVYRG